MTGSCVYGNAAYRCDGNLPDRLSRLDVSSRAKSASDVFVSVEVVEPNCYFLVIYGCPGVHGCGVEHGSQEWTAECPWGLYPLSRSLMPLLPCQPGALADS